MSYFHVNSNPVNRQWMCKLHPTVYPTQWVSIYGLFLWCWVQARALLSRTAIPPDIFVIIRFNPMAALPQA
ncbi:hypothetical protein HZ326_17907 [Fusarium oxysporum f. sp. albedinis]|nr:hypothetical protein HZ326_17907 [Fusarium oxysporum f. sp. albedinis]